MRAAILLGALAILGAPAGAAGLSEYQLKAAFLYNFAQFTSWPVAVGDTLRLCILAPDPFGPEIDALQGKAVGHRHLKIVRQPPAGSLAQCHILFIPDAAADELPRTVAGLRDSPVLTVAESHHAARQGAMLNMAVRDDKITFAANLAAAQQAQLVLSSKLLRLATEVLR